MKVVRVKPKKNCLVNFFLNKYQVFNGFADIKGLSFVLNYFKQAFLIIYYYHKSNKKILFVGLPDTKVVNQGICNKTTNHQFLPRTGWSKKILFNSVFEKTPDLIVICDSNLKELMETKFYLNKTNTPVVLLQTIGEKTKLFNNVHCVFGNFKSIKIKKFIYFLITSILKNKNKISNDSYNKVSV